LLGHLSNLINETANPRFTALLDLLEERMLASVRLHLQQKRRQRLDG